MVKSVKEKGLTQGLLLGVLCLCVAIFTLQCGGGGGGTSSSGSSGGSSGGGSGSGSGSSSVSLASLSPIVAMQNGPAFTLTVNGSGFGSGNQVVFNGTSEPTTVVNSSQLTAQIPSSALSSSGTFNVVPALSPSNISVSAGATTPNININVPSFNPPTLQLQAIGIGTTATAGILTVNPGAQNVQLFVVGNGIKPGTFYIITGNNDVTITQPIASDFTSTTDNTPAVNFNINVSSGAAPGPRNLIVENPAGEVSVFPGGIVIVSGT